MCHEQDDACYGDSTHERDELESSDIDLSPYVDEDIEL
jgi:hypothetical protein